MNQENEKLYDLPKIKGDHTLYIEVSCDNNKPIPAQQQEAGQIGHRGSKLIQATQKDIDDAKDWYRHHGSCHVHLVYDTDGFIYYFRYCGICGKYIGMI